MSILISPTHVCSNECHHRVHHHGTCYGIELKALPKLKPSLTKHIVSKSVDIDGTNVKNKDAKNKMFDLEAILDSNNLQPMNTKTTKKSNYKKFKTKNLPKSTPKFKNKSKSTNIKLKDKNIRFKQGNDKFGTRKSRRNRSISPANNNSTKKYRVRELATDLDANNNKRRSKSTNSLFSTRRRRHGWDVDLGIVENENENEINKYGWTCEQCNRMNHSEFKFCPNCGDKRPLHAMKRVFICLDISELAQGSDSEEMAESDCDSDSPIYANKYIQDEQKQMESILDEMKLENNIKMEQMQQEKDELNDLRKEDFIKTLDTIQIKNKGRSYSNSDIIMQPRAQPIVSPKENKVKKLKIIKNWILSPKSMGKKKIEYETNTNYDNILAKMGITNKYNNNNNIGYELQNEESVSMSDISYAYSIGGGGGGDAIITNNYKNKQSLELIPDTPRSTIDDPAYTFNKLSQNSPNNPINNNENENENGKNKKNKNKKNRRKKKPKSGRKKKKGKKKEITK